MNQLLENKVCVITGAAQGIGRQIAEQFASDGAIVYACDRQEFTAANEHIHPIVMDITDASSVKANLMQIFKIEGRIDCLVNNAGVVYNRKIGMIMREETERMFLVNVIAALELIQLCSRLMTRNGGGSIINIASVTAVLGSPGQVAYSATKGAVIALTQALAQELGPAGIRVNCVAPGVIVTDMCKNVEPDILNQMGEDTPVGRNGTPEDVAKAMLYLADAEFITGHVLSVNGGYVI